MLLRGIYKHLRNGAVWLTAALCFVLLDAQKAEAKAKPKRATTKKTTTRTKKESNS